MVGNKSVRWNLNHEQHRQHVIENLATDTRYSQYNYGTPEKMLARDRGRKHGMCICSQCGWVGTVFGLVRTLETSNLYAKSERRPIGYCPKCNQRPFWMPLTEAQAAILEP